eukprot:TRINITY_DN8622_c0_g1_i12.p1 TRINITY_DN8622_c0_g1~~TRINITY_DN8622_c0_g1_i12.p1  ORF type:complete len:205 (-),score=31.19 TRINITY_DN8622_c0_g1_i12:17-631(-)
MMVRSDAVMMPDTVIGGPGTAVDPNFVTLLSRAKIANVPILGFVYTSFGGRNISEVMVDIDNYYKWYPTLSGIYIGDSDSGCDVMASYYGVLWNYTRAHHNNATFVLQIGTLAHECSLNVSTIVVNLESYYYDEMAWTAPAWTENYPPERFWHLVFETPLNLLDKVYKKAVENRAGHVLITDQDIFDYSALPSYLGELVALVDV